MTEVIAPQNVGTLPPVERALEELHKEEASRVGVAMHGTTTEDNEEERAGLKVRSFYGNGTSSLNN